jgi:hypothetical protein
VSKVLRPLNQARLDLAVKAPCVDWELFGSRKDRDLVRAVEALRELHGMEEAWKKERKKSNEPLRKARSR